jgi:hypothetical protein
MLGFPLRRRNHDDGIPRATIEEGALRPAAQALPAADALERVDDNVLQGICPLVAHQDHAFLDRAVWLADWGPSATGACFGDDGKEFGFDLAATDEPPREVLLRVLLHTLRRHYRPLLRARFQSFTHVRLPVQKLTTQ